jgi:cation-transporting ATPase F
VVLLLETDPHRGLSSEDATDRLARFGPNTLPAAKGAGLPMRILRQFHHPLIYVLLAAGVITAGLGEYVDSAVIFGVVVVNAIVGFIQESKAEAALEGLRSMCAPTPRWCVTAMSGLCRPTNSCPAISCCSTRATRYPPTCG